jgi:uncharacterized delta-60 repeat protein
MVIRYLSTGERDSGFGNNGVAITSLSSLDIPTGVKISKSGQILLFGRTQNALLGEDLCSVMYNATDGSLDPFWGGTGVVITAVGGFFFSCLFFFFSFVLFTANAKIEDVFFQDDGQILALVSSGSLLALLQYNARGTGGALVSSIVGDIANLRRLFFDSSRSSYLIGGYRLHNGKNEVVLARYTQSLALETCAFCGNDGIVKHDLAVFSYLRRMKTDQFDRIVGVGAVYNDTTNINDVLVARFLPTGALDRTFGSVNGGGFVRLSLGMISDDQGFGLAIQEDGRIVVGGFSAPSNNLTVFRLLENGALDDSFASVSVNVGTSDNPRVSVAMQQGKIVLATYFQESGMRKEMCVLRFLENGALDSTFAVDGLFRTHNSNLNDEYVFDLAIQPSDDKIVIVGYSGSPLHVTVARLTINGALDNTFGGNPGAGIVQTFIQSNSLASCVAIQPADGKIVVGGLSETQFCIVRYNGDGSLDLSFGANGVVVDAMKVNNLIYAIAIQPADGRIVVAGTAFDGGGGAQQFAVARRNTVSFFFFLSSSSSSSCSFYRMELRIWDFLELATRRWMWGLGWILGRRWLFRTMEKW